MEGRNSPKRAYIEKYTGADFASEIVLTASFTERKRYFYITPVSVLCHIYITFYNICTFRGVNRRLLTHLHVNSLSYFSRLN